MSNSIWLNGRVMPMSEARIPVEDRGFQFGDGVYEVVRIYKGRCFALRSHMRRLEASARAVSIKLSYSIDELSQKIEQFVAAGALADGMVYLQVTRGCAPRNHLFPVDATPTVLFYTKPLPPVPPPGTDRGQKVIAVADERWRKCWIKSTALLANVLARNNAAAAGADEAAFVENNVVSECSASNLFAVIDDTLVTHPVGARVLGGVTRSCVIEVARELQISVAERPPAVEEIERATELFLTGTTREIMWVSHWNDRALWPRCGEVTRRLHHAFQSAIERSLR